MIHRGRFLGYAFVVGVVCACGSAIAVDRVSSDRKPGVVRISRGEFDLTQGAPKLAPTERSPLKLDERSHQYFIVASDPRKLGARGLDELRRRVVELGGEFVGELPVAAFLVRLSARSHEYIVGHGGILAVEPYHAGFKLQSSVEDVLAAAGAEAVAEWDIRLFRKESPEDVATHIRSMQGEVLARSGGWIHARLQAGRLLELAALESVRAIHHHQPAQLQGEKATSALLNGAYLPDGLLPYREAGIDGSGNELPNTTIQSVMVLDTGIQIDTPELSQTMASAGAPGPDHRKVLFNGTTVPWGGSGDGLGCAPLTHGNVSTVIAVGAAATVPPEYGPPWPNFKDRRLDGVATGARVASYDAVNGCGPLFLPGDLYTEPSFGSMPHARSNFGTHIYNFSWGTPGNQYNSFATDSDDYLHDTADAMIFASAGNSGPEVGSLLAPANAKNVIAVGGTHTGPHPTTDLDDRWYSSSLGPAAASRRVAPLLMAPACDAPSVEAEEYYFCGIVDDDQDDPVDCSFVIEGTCGTSEASPAAAGTALLVRDYFQQGFYPDGRSDNVTNAADQVGNISGALLKATLIASADWVGKGNALGGNLSIPHRFNNEQGYGRIQLNQVLPLSSWTDNPLGLIVHDGGIAGGVRDLSLPATINAMAGETLSGTFEVIDPSQELRVALAWLEDSGDFLINNLDLRLTSPDPDADGPLQPVVYFGNYFTDDNNRNGLLGPGEDCPGIDGATGLLDASPWSLPSCSNAATDRRNPTEAVFLSPDADADGDNDPDFNQLLAGTWTIDITATVGGTDPAQRFALVIGGGVTVRSTIRWAPGPFACNEPAVLKLLEVDEANDPVAALTPAEIASRVTIRVLDPDTRAVLDEETGVTSWSQPIPGIAGFESDPLWLIPDSTPTIGNGLVEVDDSRIVEAVYADEINDDADASRESRTSNPTTCGLSAPGEAEDLLVTDFDPATGEISISYTAACSAVDHTLVLGPLGQVSTYGYSDQICGLGTAGTASFASGPGSLFYLVVANDGTTEGPYGEDSEGVERPGQNPQPSCSFEHLPGLACE